MIQFTLSRPRSRYWFVSPSKVKTWKVNLNTGPRDNESVPEEGLLLFNTCIIDVNENRIGPIGLYTY